jgi:hypothetical protein
MTGLTRTATQRTQEIKDIDLNADNRISFIEYMLLHYKAMILTYAFHEDMIGNGLSNEYLMFNFLFREYYKRNGLRDEFDLSNGAVGVTGVGTKLLEELFTSAKGIDPAIEKVIQVAVFYL